MTRDEAAWAAIFKELRVTGDIEQAAVRGQFEHALGHYKHARWFHNLDDKAILQWRNATLRHASKLAELLQAVPFPYDDHPIFHLGDPSEPMSSTIEQLLTIEKELMESPPVPRPRRRPKADYSDLVELIRNVEPVYFKCTGKTAAAGNARNAYAKGGGPEGPFVRLMRELIKLAHERPVDNAIRMAVKAHQKSGARRATWDGKAPDLASGFEFNRDRRAEADHEEK